MGIILIAFFISFFFKGIEKSFMQLQECSFQRNWFWRNQSVKELKEISNLSRPLLCSMKTWVPPEACNKKRLTFVSQLFIWTWLKNLNFKTFTLNDGKVIRVNIGTLFHLYLFVPLEA